MPEPVTTAALAIAGISWLGAAAAEGYPAIAIDRLLVGLLPHLKNRVAGLRGLPENDDVARAVRTAQMHALETLIRNYRKEQSKLDPFAAADAPPPAFFGRSLAFCARTVGRCRDLTVKLNMEVTEPLGAAIEGLLGQQASGGPAGNRAEAIAFFAENAVLDELREELGDVALPGGFETYFRHGQGDGEPRFLDLFGHFIAEHGGALQTLGERESGTARLDESVAAYDAALEVFSAAGADHYVTVCRANRDRALALLEVRRKR